MKDRYIRFTTLITRIMRNIRRIATDTVAHYDIKRSYVSLIYFLYKNGPLSAARLCSLCGEDKANVSRTLRALEEDGYIVREERRTAHSRIRMMLTEDGMGIGSYFAERVTEALEMATEGVDPADIDAMYRALERIDANLESTSPD